MDKDLIDKMKYGTELSEEEILVFTTEMDLALERDITKFGKGTIPREESEFALLWAHCICNIKNTIRVYRIMEQTFLMLTDYFNSHKPFGPSAPDNTIECFKYIDQETGSITYDSVSPWQKNSSPTLDSIDSKKV
jgi:hypothetical protein